MKLIKYRNSFYDKRNQYSKEYKFPDGESIYDYKGYYIFKNTLFCLDIVTLIGAEWVCLSQVGSIRYAKSFIDHGCIHGDYRLNEEQQ